MSAIIPLAPNVTPRMIGREQTILEIEKTIDIGSSFMIIGKRGSGKTKLINDIVIPRLDKLSRQIWGEETTKKIYWYVHRGELDDIAGIETILNHFIVPVFELKIAPAPPFEMEYIFWLKRLCYNLLTVRNVFKLQTYFIVDEIERLSALEVTALETLLSHAIIIGASRPTRTNIKVLSFFENVSYIKFTIGPLTRPQAAELFYDALSQAGLNNLGSELVTFFKTKLMNQIRYPQAIIYPITESLSKIAQATMVTKKTIRDLRLHRSGFEQADLTMAFFIIIFGFLFMRAITMRGPESYKYGIYMFASLAAMWAWRIMSKKIQTSEKETDIIVNTSEDESPKWYGKIAGPVGLLAHILASWILLTVIFLFIGTELKLSHLVFTAISTIIPDIDHEYSTISKIFRFLTYPIIMVSKLLHLPVFFQKIKNIPSWVETHWGHRNVTHWFVTWLIFSIISFILFQYFKIDTLCFVCFSLGYLFHTFYDAVSPSGVSLSGPSQVKWVTPPGYSMRVRVGSLREGIVCLIFGIIFLLMCPVAVYTTSGFLQKWVKNPDAAVAESRKRITNKRVFITVTGKHIATQVPIENKEFEVINSIGNILYLLKNEIVYKYAGIGGFGDIDSIRMLNTRYGDKQIEFATRKIVVSYLMSFEQLFYDIKADEFVSGKMQVSGVSFLLSPVLTTISYSTVIMKPKEIQNTMIIDITLDCVTREMIKIFLDKGTMVNNADLFLFKREETTEKQPLSQESQASKSGGWESLW